MMSPEQIIEKVREDLNKEGRQWNLEFDVDHRVLRDGAWLQIFVKSNSNRGNRAAESQIISDVESDASAFDGHEVVVQLEDSSPRRGSWEAVEKVFGIVVPPPGFDPDKVTRDDIYE